MNRVLITGADGFLGRNLAVRLAALGIVEVIGADLNTGDEEWKEALRTCETIFHLAGVNRPSDPADFRRTNCDLTAHLCETLKRLGRAPRIVFSSSIQAALNNPYGISKKEAEQVLLRFGAEAGAAIRIYRLKNIFGKWCRPNYNSVVATFCHNIANELPIRISDPNTTLDLTYVDDVVEAFLDEIGSCPSPESGFADGERLPSHALTLGELARTIQMFRNMRDTLLVPEFSLAFHRQLYATYLSYVPVGMLETRLHAKRDNRGSLAEFMKSNQAGQIFLSRTLPGITRGNHYHHTKTEKFLVVEGDGLLRMRQISGSTVVEYRLRGSDYQVVDIPPGYTHSIENVGAGEMVTLFWSSEVFSPDCPDTIFLPVDPQCEPVLDGPK